MTYYLTTALDILCKASSVPSDMCFFIKPLNSPKMPFTLISHCTSTRVLFVSIGVSTIFFVPVMAPSVIFFSTEFLGFKVITSLHIEFLNAITASLSIRFPFFLIFLIDLVPCQNSGSLSTSEIIFHMLSCDASICFVMRKSTIFNFRLNRPLF